VNSLNGRVSANIHSEHFHRQNIEKRGEGASLPNPTAWFKLGREITINND